MTHYGISIVQFLLFLVVMELDAQESLPLTWEHIFTQNFGARQAALSPDGEWVAITARTEDQSGIFIKEVASDAPPRFLTSGGSPAWFGDSNKLVFSSRGDLWTIAIDDDTPSQITSDTRDERAPQPSPDGSWVAFYSGRSGYQDIWIVPADGSQDPRQITQDAMALDDYRFAPSWSPDSKRLAYYSFKGHYWEDDIWVVDLATGTEEQVSHNLMAMSKPVWSPDGSTIALFANAKDEYWYEDLSYICLLYTSPSPRDKRQSRMPSSA